MKDEYRVLVLGNSTYGYTEGNPDHAYPAFLRTHLGREFPDVRWHCASERLYTSPGMAKRAAAFVEEHRPDIVVFAVSSTNFAQDQIVNAIRDRWPPLYEPSKKIAEWARAVAGGGSRGADSPRGWIYRGPHALIARALGAEPAMELQEAVEAVTDTVKACLRNEDTHVLVRISRPEGRTEEEALRKQVFTRAILDFLAQRRIPSYQGGTRRLGVDRKKSPDNWHAVPAQREVDALVMARVLAHTLRHPGLSGFLKPEDLPAWPAIREAIARLQSAGIGA